MSTLGIHRSYIQHHKKPWNIINPTYQVRKYIIAQLVNEQIQTCIVIIVDQHKWNGSNTWVEQTNNGKLRLRSPINISLVEVFCIDLCVEYYITQSLLNPYLFFILSDFWFFCLILNSGKRPMPFVFHRLCTTKKTELSDVSIFISRK